MPPDAITLKKTSCWHIFYIALFSITIKLVKLLLKQSLSDTLLDFSLHVPMSCAGMKKYVLQSWNLSEACLVERGKDKVCSQHFIQLAGVITSLNFCLSKPNKYTFLLGTVKSLDLVIKINLLFYLRDPWIP